MELSEILKIAEENNNKEKRAFLFPGQGAQYVGMVHPCGRLHRCSSPLRQKKYP